MMDLAMEFETREQANQAFQMIWDKLVTGEVVLKPNNDVWLLEVNSEKEITNAQIEKILTTIKGKRL